MSYIGITKIGKMFLGDTEIAKAYLGTDLVFQKDKQHFTYLQYIENQLGSDAYIKTGILTSPTLNYDIDFMSYDDLNSTSFGCILGARYSSNNNDFQLSTWTGEDKTDGLLRLGTITYNYTAHLPTKNTRVIVRLAGTSYTVGATTYNVGRPSSFTGYELYILALNQQDNAVQNGHGRLYSLKLYSGDTLVRDYVPAIRNSNNEVGMLDLVTNQFFGSANNTAFVAGPLA